MALSILYSLLPPISFLTSFIVIIDSNSCWFGFLHHCRLINLEREGHLGDLIEVQDHVLTFHLIPLDAE